MSQGPGLAQRAILDALYRAGAHGMTTVELVLKTDRSARQVRSAVDALVSRELVYVEHVSLGHREDRRGKHGRRVWLASHYEKVVARREAALARLGRTPSAIDSYSNPSGTSPS